MAAAKRWYIEATGHTNEVIARDLPAENAHANILCADEKKRDLWECEYQFVSKLLKNEESAQLKFSVFYREGNGPIKPWPFLRRKKVAATIRRKGKEKRAAAAT